MTSVLAQASTDDLLKDGREWLFDTATPSLADIALHFLLFWVYSAKGTESVFDKTKVPNVHKVKSQ